MPAAASFEMRVSPAPRRFCSAGAALAACLGLVPLFAGEARAEWRLQLGLDISTASDSVLLVGELDERATLYAKCLPKTERPAELSVHVFDGSSDPLTGPAISEIAVSTDAGGLWSSPGERRRVPGYIVTQWADATTIRGLLDSIVGAKAEIRIEIRGPMFRQSWTTSATGSTAAGRAFIEACAARLPAAPQDSAPDPQVTIPPPAMAPVLPVRRAVPEGT